MIIQLQQNKTLHNIQIEKENQKGSWADPWKGDVGDKLRKVLSFIGFPSFIQSISGALVTNFMFPGLLPQDCQPYSQNWPNDSFHC